MILSLNIHPHEEARIYAWSRNGTLGICGEDGEFQTCVFPDRKQAIQISEKIAEWLAATEPKPTADELMGAKNEKAA